MNSEHVLARLTAELAVVRWARKRAEDIKDEGCIALCGSREERLVDATYYLRNYRLTRDEGGQK